MQGSRPASWRHPCRRGAAALGVIAFSVMLNCGPAGLGEAQAAAGRPNPDWPCRQIMVGHLSAAAVWSGPAIDGVAWQKDPAVAELVAKLAARRLPLEDAERMIADFAKAQGNEKTQKLTAVFAGLFETLDDERTQVIEGLLRFGAKQKELAAKIRAENAAPREAPGKTPEASGQEGSAAAGDLEWDLRVFEERRQSLTYVCETPTLIEQRLFALAKIIQRDLE